MRFLRSKRGLGVLSLLMAVVGLTLWVVLPAFAATSTPHRGATSTLDAIQPQYLASGGENDCALFGPNIGTDQYFVTNPKAISDKPQTVTASNGMKVTFTVHVNPSYTYLDFSVSGGVVTDVGIKGGNGTDWYSYEPGGVTQDSLLTAPAQSTAGQPPFYNLSQTVFCYTPGIACQPGVPLSDPQHLGGTVELPSCKHNVFDFDSGVKNGRNFVSVYSYGGSGTANIPMVEHIAGTLSGSPPTQTTLQYSDLNLPGPGPLHDMRFCKLDPRAGGAASLTLADGYKSIPPVKPVLQSPTNDDPESTSCLISISTWVDANGVVHFEAYFYSLIDGYEAF